MQGSVGSDGSRMVAGRNAGNALEFPDESGVALVDLVAYSQLAVLVVAHAVDLPGGREQQRVEDPALHLPHPVREVDQHGSGYLLGPVHPQLSVLVGPAHVEAAFAVSESAVHGPAGKASHFPLHHHLPWAAARFEFPRPQSPVVSQSPGIELLVIELHTDVAEAALNFYSSSWQFDPSWVAETALEVRLVASSKAAV